MLKAATHFNSILLRKHAVSWKELINSWNLRVCTIQNRITKRIFTAWSSSALLHRSLRVRFDDLSLARLARVRARAFVEWVRATRRCSAVTARGQAVVDIQRRNTLVMAFQFWLQSARYISGGRTFSVRWTKRRAIKRWQSAGVLVRELRSRATLCVRSTAFLRLRVHFRAWRVARACVRVRAVLRKDFQKVIIHRWADYTSESKVREEHFQSEFDFASDIHARHLTESSFDVWRANFATVGEIAARGAQFGEDSAWRKCVESFEKWKSAA
eukprot:417173_1